MAEKKSSEVGAEPKEATTEPSVIKKLKRGGSAKGGTGGGKGSPPGAEKKAVAEMPHAEPKAMKEFESEVPKVGGLKKGGKVESLKKELRRHEEMKAPPAHTGKVLKKATGGIIPSPFKKGGSVLLGGTGRLADSSRKGAQEVVERMVQNKADGGGVKKFENTKVTEAPQTKSFNTQTGGVEGKGYKKGGEVHHKHKTHGHHDGVMRKASGGSVEKFAEDKHDTFTGHPGGSKTGEIKQSPAGYKHGGHVSHSHAMNKSHDGHGHKAMGGDGHGHKAHHEMAHGGRVHGGKVKNHCSGGSAKKY